MQEAAQTSQETLLLQQLFVECFRLADHLLHREMFGDAHAGFFDLKLPSGPVWGPEMMSTA
jgi:hypothetical protein